MAAVSDPYLLGIDLGTTTCRAAIFDLDGNEVAAAYREMAVQYPRPLWAEIDPEEWWRGTIGVVRQVLDTVGVAAERIAGIGLTGLMHAPVLLDGVGRSVAPAMLWMDQRCAPQAEALRLDYAARGLNPGYGASTGQSAPKLRWLAEIQPDVLARARRFMLPKDFIRYRLTGVDGTDASDAGGTGMFDRARGDWAWEIVELTGTPRSLLPTIRPAAACAGGVTDAAARQTGLAPGTPVAVGGADTFCTRLGVGGPGAGELCMYLGTAAWVSQTSGPGQDGKPAIRSFGATSTTGAALRWARDVLLGADGETVSASYDALTALARDVAPGAEGLFFLPHLMGERGPRAEPLARGALVGLTLRHGRPQIVRAVLEGTAFHLRRLLAARTAEHWPEGGSPTGGVACGGAARSELWMQLLVDVTRLSLRVPVVVEAGVLGAAMLGGAAAGLLSIDTAPARMVRFARAHEPAPRAAVEYDHLYARYCQLDDLLAPWFREGNVNGE